MENNNTETTFEGMSNNFQRAFEYLNAGYYAQSIPFFENALKEDKNNYPALNGLAVAQINIGVKNKDKSLIESAISNLQDAIRIEKDVTHAPNGYEMAIGNLQWAEEELHKLT